MYYAPKQYHTLIDKIHLLFRDSYHADHFDVLWNINPNALA